jgi:hypothetical protein
MPFISQVKDALHSRMPLVSPHSLTSGLVMLISQFLECTRPCRVRRVSSGTAICPCLTASE